MSQCECTAQWREINELATTRRRVSDDEATTTRRRHDARDANTGPTPDPNYKREPFATHSGKSKNYQTQWVHRVELVGFCVFFSFSRGFLLLRVENQKKPRENQKNQNNQNYQTQWVHRVELFGFFVFLFSRWFLLLWAENQKNLEKTKKKTTRPNGYIGLNFLVS